MHTRDVLPHTTKVAKKKFISKWKTISQRNISSLWYITQLMTTHMRAHTKEMKQTNDQSQKKNTSDKISIRRIAVGLTRATLLLFLVFLLFSFAIAFVIALKVGVALDVLPLLLRFATSLSLVAVAPRTITVVAWTRARFLLFVHFLFVFAFALARATVASLLFSVAFAFTRTRVRCGASIVAITAATLKEEEEEEEAIKPDLGNYCEENTTTITNSIILQYKVEFVNSNENLWKSFKTKRILSSKYIHLSPQNIIFAIYAISSAGLWVYVYWTPGCLLLISWSKVSKVPQRIQQNASSLNWW